MVYPSSAAYTRVGLLPEQRLRWVLDFGSLDAAELDAKERAATVQDARTFMLIQEADPGFRPLLRSWVPLRDDTPGVLTQERGLERSTMVEGRTGVAAPGRKVGLRPEDPVRNGCALRIFGALASRLAIRTVQSPGL